jgi:hypothetical protein
MTQILLLLQFVLSLYGSPQMKNPDFANAVNTLANLTIQQAITVLNQTSTEPIAPVVIPAPVIQQLIVPQPVPQPIQTNFGSTMTKEIKILPIETYALSTGQISPIRYVYASYSEDGVPVSGVELTISADDGGRITHSGISNKFGAENNKELTNASVQVFNIPDFKNGVEFEYQPILVGDRVITISGNGATQTAIAPGIQ